MACHGIPFEGYMAWNYLDLGALGADKELEGVDLVIDGLCEITIGYNEKDFSQATPPYLVIGDTLPNIGMIPFPMRAPSFQVRLTFLSDAPWQWSAANIYKLGEYGQ